MELLHVLGMRKLHSLADSFQSKWQVPLLEDNFYSLESTVVVSFYFSLLQIRSRDAFHFLNSLRFDSATGPDGVFTILHRHIVDTICYGFALLGPRILECSWWPTNWKSHWIFLLFKRGKRDCCDNYRGLDLISQLSKCMERFIGMHFMYRLFICFGDAQFAYRRFYG